MIELRAIDKAEIHTATSVITPAQSIAFAAALYLIIRRGRPVSRRVLSSLLWPDATSQVRGHRLRQTLLQLKRLGLTLSATREAMVLPPDDLHSDLDRLSELAESLPSLRVLPGYAPEFSEPFLEWLEETRRTIHAQATSSLLRAISGARQKGDWLVVEELSSKCLELDEFNESAVLARAEAAAMRGAKLQAVEILERFAQEIGPSGDLRLPAEMLRRRIVERLPLPVVKRHAAPFLGRESDFAILSGRIRSARSGNGGAALIVGAPGIGKTRLAAELGRLAQLQGTEVVQITCRSSDAMRPLSLFVDLVPHIRELRGALGCAPATLTVLKRLTDFERIEDSSRPTDSYALFGTVRAAIFDLLESVADENCLVVLVDDVQWLDAQSAKLLGQIAEWAVARKALFVLTARPQSKTVETLAEDAKLTPLPLRPLNRPSATLLLEELCAQVNTRMHERLADWCLSVAEGNPFFLQELVQQWIETGHEYEVPESISKVLDGRMSRLSPIALRVLQTSALLGEHATLERVHAILGLEAHQLVSAIEELHSSAMLSSPTDDLARAGTGLRSRHDLIAMSATDRLSPLSLTFLHRRAAEVLESEISSETRETALLWACANHRLLSGEKEQALGNTMSCAEHLLRMGLAQESADAFKKALEYCTTNDQRLRVLPRLALSLQADAKWEESKQVLQECISLHASMHPSESKHNEFEILLLEARYHSSFDYVELLDDLTPCVECSDASASHRVRAGIQALKLATDTGPRNLIDSVYHHLEPLLTNSEVRRQDALEVELVYGTLVRSPSVKAAQYRAFLTEGSPETVEYFRRLLTVVSSCRLFGRYEQGLAFAAEAVQCAAASNLSNYVAQAKLGEVQLHVAAGEYSMADKALHQVFEKLGETRNPRLREEPYYMEARIAFELCDVDRCARALEKTANPTSSYSPTRRAYLYALHVALRLLKNETPEALLPWVTLLRAAHEQSKSFGLHDFEAYVLHRGLTACAGEAIAVAVLRDYLFVHRRCAWPVSDRLRPLAGMCPLPRTTSLGPTPAQE